MSKIYLISDTHFGHNGISKKFRPEFGSDEEHNETIHDNIMDCCGKRNSLWILGDVCFKVDQFYRLWQYSLSFEQVNVVLGNHEHNSLVEYCVQHGIKVHGVVKKWRLWLSHAPIHPQELYRGKNIHGHVHRNTVPDPNYFNVSCENLNYKPITLQEIRERMEVS